ncbi:peptidoglycan DD-metalloendopeptidase family protein [Burkholderia oklahomensis]|nr:peptidoglycan DD-metalloendopeptidase family protein [Burkholderia oklahomensis]
MTGVVPSMSKSEIDRSVAWLSGMAAALVVVGCATTSPVTPTDTLAGAAAAASSASAAQAAAAPPAGDAAQHQDKPAAPAPVVTRYVVKRGDTLSAIADANGCTVRDLQAWNHMGRRTRIAIGQVLRIAPPGAENAAALQAANGANSARAPGNADATRTNDSANGASAAPAGGTNPSSSVADAPQPASTPESAADRAADRRVVRETKRHAQSIALAWPAKGAIAETFQPGRNRGIRIVGHAGDPVRAAASGRVMYAGTGLNGYGTLILVQHNADFLTAYAHNRKVLVKTGDVVQQGEQIAEMGIGDSARAGMLFEVRRDGKPVNPMQYLPGRQQG